MLAFADGASWRAFISILIFCCSPIYEIRIVVILKPEIQTFTSVKIFSVWLIPVYKLNSPKCLRKQAHKWDDDLFFIFFQSLAAFALSRTLLCFFFIFIIYLFFYKFCNIHTVHVDLGYWIAMLGESGILSSLLRFIDNSEWTPESNSIHTSKQMWLVLVEQITRSDHKPSWWSTGRKVDCPLPVSSQ